MLRLPMKLQHASRLRQDRRSQQVKSFHKQMLANEYAEVVMGVES